jgi:hypothetical protein
MRFPGQTRSLPNDSEFTRILQWPGYRVYRHVIDEKTQTLELWVRRKRGNRKLECSGCGRKFEDAYDANGRAVRDPPWSTFTTTVPKKPAVASTILVTPRLALPTQLIEIKFIAKVR